MGYQLSELCAGKHWFTALTPLEEGESITAFSMHPLTSTHLIITCGADTPGVITSAAKILKDAKNEKGEVITEMFCGFNKEEIDGLTSLKALDEWVKGFTEHLEAAVKEESYCYYVDLPIVLGKAFMRIKKKADAKALRSFYQKLFKTLNTAGPVVIFAHYNLEDGVEYDHGTDPALAFMAFARDELLG